MNRKLLPVIALMTLYFFAFASTTHASHYIWLVHDAGKQLSGITGSESRASWWFINGTYASYYTDSTTISTNVSSAASNWTAKIPQAKFSSTTSTSADITFSYSDTFCASGDWGCHSLTAAYNDTTREANFTTKSKIVITSTPSSSERTYVAAHEIGHHLGLHERYTDTGSVSCNTETTVMDAGNCEELTGPSDTDKFRFDNFLGNGYAESITIASNSTGGTEFHWKDKAYGEIRWEIHLQKQTTAGTWTTVASKTDYTSKSGLVSGLSWIADKDLYYNFYLSSYGRGTYRAEIKPYFASYAKYGTVSYSPTVVY